jgi:cathepsin D
MRLDALPVTFSLALLLCADYALAAPSSPDHHQQQRDAASSSSRRSLHIPIVRRAPVQRNDAELGLWAKQQKEFLEAKYGGQRSGSKSSKRSTGYNMCVWCLPFL